MNSEHEEITRELAQLEQWFGSLPEVEHRLDAAALKQCVRVAIDEHWLAGILKDAAPVALKDAIRVDVHRAVAQQRESRQAVIIRAGRSRVLRISTGAVAVAASVALLFATLTGLWNATSTERFSYASAFPIGSVDESFGDSLAMLDDEVSELELARYEPFGSRWHDSTVEDVGARLEELSDEVGVLSRGL